MMFLNKLKFILRMDTRIPKELELVKLVNEGKQLGKRTWPQKLKYKEKVGA